MGELLDQFVIELKNLAKFLKIEEVKEEPHHSEPYNEPRGQISQVMTGRGAGYTAKSMTLLGELCPNTVEEYNYLYKIGKPWGRF